MSSSSQSASGDEQPVTASVIGGRGYTGGEVLRLIHTHPHIDLHQVTSRSRAGRSIGSVHPNLRGMDVRFVEPDDLEPVDVIYAATPHGVTSGMIDDLQNLADLVVDLSADFRLSDPAMYETWYEEVHPHPELLAEAAYGLPELGREAIRNADIIACGGCNATAAIIGLYPLAKAGILATADPIVVDVKVGSSEGGLASGPAASHVERSGVVRPYAPTGHRHEAEIIEHLGTEVSFSAHAVDMIRGASATCHVFPEEVPETPELWKLFRDAYEDEPFVRLQAGGGGIYRYPEAKVVAGTNMAEVGFIPDDDRIVIVSALDNLVKGSAGQAIHATNVALGFDETAGLTFPGLHPVGAP